MATAPQVQTLAQIMAELEPATSKQTSLIQAKQAGLGAKYEGEQKALDAIKAQSMNTINTQATGRGMAFSGIPLDEQATYLSTEYMPSVAKLKTAQTEESSGLEKQLADIYSQNYNTAFSTRNTQQSALNNWNLQVMQQEAAAAEAEKNRQFEAAQAEANRRNQAYLASLNNQADDSLTSGQVAAVIKSYVTGKQGKDTYVSPKTYAQGYPVFYEKTGGDVETYKALMAAYVNPSHAKDYRF